MLRVTFVASTIFRNRCLEAILFSLEIPDAVPDKPNMAAIQYVILFSGLHIRWLTCGYPIPEDKTWALTCPVYGLLGSCNKRVAEVLELSSWVLK